MKILIINGSPKREASDTMHITHAFVDGMNQITANEVTLLNTIDAHIEPCRGCLTCKHNGGTCVIDHDDMQHILQQLLASDLLLFSFPLYNFGLPSTLKALLDRTMPLSSIAMRKVENHYEHVEQTNCEHLRYLMICGCGFPNATHNFEGMITQWHLMFGTNATALTIPEAPMFNAPEADSVTKPFLKIVKQAGKEYAQNGFIEAATMHQLAQPMIPEEVYAKICNGEI